MAEWIRARRRAHRTVQSLRATLADLFAEMAAAGWIAVNLADVTRTIGLDGVAGSILLATRPGVGVDGPALTLPAHTAVVLAPAAE